jgi:hypothetical protein
MILKRKKNVCTQNPHHKNTNNRIIYFTPKNTYSYSAAWVDEDDEVVVKTKTKHVLHLKEKALSGHDYQQKLRHRFVVIKYLNVTLLSVYIYIVDINYSN